MRISTIYRRLKGLHATSLGFTVLGAFLMAIALYALVSALAWVLSCVPGLADTVQRTSLSLGVEPSQLLEFNAIVVTAIFIAVQLWVTNRRADAAQATAQAAADTAQSTVSSNTARQFRDAIEALGSTSPVVRVGGVQALAIIARDYHDYRPAVAEVMQSHIRADEPAQ